MGLFKKLREKHDITHMSILEATEIWEELTLEQQCELSERFSNVLEEFSNDLGKVYSR